MDKNKDRGASWLETRVNHFAQTMSLINRVLGEQAFRLIDEDGKPLLDGKGKPLPRGVNRALFDAQSIAFGWVEASEDDELDTDRLVRELARALKHDDFLDAVRLATGDRTRIRFRVRRMVKALRTGGLNVTVPAKLALETGVGGT